ncbi:MAG: leucyl/phenylalanyl-tRNA--protein transferase [Paracoccaceae bacterium]
MAGGGQGLTDAAPLTPDLLLAAYRNGLFPMSEHRDDPEIFWVDPHFRGIFRPDQIHVSRSLARTIRQDTFRVTMDHAFDDVVLGCADRDETWINGPIRQIYGDLHRAGTAHSLEVWVGDALVGGVYGVSIGGAFFGESMFSRRRDASKVALVWLLEHLRACGFGLFDTQFLTDHLASLGAVEVPRATYHDLLQHALEIKTQATRLPLLPSGQAVLQRRTQTS